MGQQSLHASRTGSKLIGLPEVTLLTRVARHPLCLCAHAQYAKCILPQTFGTGLLWARYTGTWSNIADHTVMNPNVDINKASETLLFKPSSFIV